MMIDKQKLLDILTSEIESSTGCTDPGSVCLAVAVAAHTLGRRPEKNAGGSEKRTRGYCHWNTPRSFKGCEVQRSWPSDCR